MTDTVGRVEFDSTDGAKLVEYFRRDKVMLGRARDALFELLVAVTEAENAQTDIPEKMANLKAAKQVAKDLLSERADAINEGR